MTIKYSGDVIYSNRDDYGPIEVVEAQQKLRSLHFGNRTQQATMLLYNPIVLVHKYTQAMLTPLCWQPSPERVLILGLGGGSLARYLLYHLGHVKIDAVELRPQVSRIAREYFDLPEESPNFHIHHCSAEDFLGEADGTPAYDLILVDLFLTSRAEDVSVGVGRQIEKLAQLLTDDGSMTINAIGQSYEQYPELDDLSDMFGEGLYVMPVDQSNMVLLARHNDIPGKHSIDFTTHETKLGLPFRQYYGKLMPA